MPDGTFPTRNSSSWLASFAEFTPTTDISPVVSWTSSLASVSSLSTSFTVTTPIVVVSVSTVSASRRRTSGISMLAPPRSVNSIVDRRNPQVHRQQAAVSGPPVKALIVEQQQQLAGIAIKLMKKEEEPQNRKRKSDEPFKHQSSSKKQSRVTTGDSMNNENETSTSTEVADPAYRHHGINILYFREAVTPRMVDAVVEESNAAAAASEQSMPEETLNDTESVSPPPPAENALEDPGVSDEDIVGTPLENEGSHSEFDSEEEDDDIQITIGDLKTNVNFRGSNKQPGGKHTSKLDIDGTATVNGASIYDLDINALDEQPWRKPGADITDYFNYGFTEESWLIYCERQRKLRAEYGPMNANKVLFVNLTGLTNPVQSVLNEKSKYHNSGPSGISVITNLAPPTPSMQPQPIMRTVLTGTKPETMPPHPAPVLSTPVVSHQSNLTVLQQPSILQSSPSHSPESQTPQSTADMPQKISSTVPSIGTSSANGAPSSVGQDNIQFPDISFPPPCIIPLTNVPPPGFPPQHSLSNVPSLPPTNVPPPSLNQPPFGHPPPPGIGFPMQFGYPPPSRPVLPPRGYAGFEPMPRDEARSPASYSDKSSDGDERDRYERHRHREYRHRRSRSPYDVRNSHGRFRERERYRSHHRSKSPVERIPPMHYGREEKEFEEKERRTEEKERRRRSDDEEGHKRKRRQVYIRVTLLTIRKREESREESKKERDSKKNRDKEEKSESGSSKRHRRKESSSRVDTDAESSKL
ncbi:unnamed protein product [Soboliphyme baturini]|uniref:Pre-mRNA 3'-end-processing factor FIP1 n=1 Tax=Soboliphyme baturini TaxID=241478 RepID=A0A183IW94_9BILA|nr:unnamed protein product [Soboliphyme baturini]